ncbi:FecR domain-containing protein [Pseudoxanthomonas mexicana]|uniref:FecR domain-containing protein n=1 Tax=Pseudoxanthomonas mexicana TaxID=128785 RepID=A0A7G9T9L6_PSEMX|nr:FecR domain-containing protein [Pseudoxanthomonas mexicana]
MTSLTDEPLDPLVLDQAVNWLLRLNSGSATDAERAALARWRDSDPEHARAWERAEKLRKLLDQIPPALGARVLDRPSSPGRRSAIKQLGLLLACAPGGWLALKAWNEAAWTADARTAVGQRRAVPLPDGSHLELNTNTAVDITFDVRQRRLELRRGEILVETSPDPQSPARAFTVATPHGLLHALGTRFSVLSEHSQSRVAVLEGAVRVTSIAGIGATIIQAGQQAWFDAHRVATATAADERLVAWRHGMLAADRLPLGEVVAELGRYRRGLLRCDPAVATLPVSGAFPLDDTERSLTMLTSTYPLDIRQAAGGYWTTVGPR